MIDPYQLTLIVAIIFFIAEILTGSLILFAFSFAFGVVAIVQFIQSGYLIERDLIILISSSVVGIIFLRIRYRKKTDEKILKDDDINLY
jgi:membrane protein implicated in regulation of membrane protease activity